MTIWMIVEDEPDLQEMLCLMVESIGHEVLSFSDGEEAQAWVDSVEQADSVSELPELALIDIRLPDSVGGPEVAARLRQNQRLKDMAVVLMTAYRLSAEEETAIMAYATPDMLLYKPLPPFADFCRKLEDLLM